MYNGEKRFVVQKIIDIDYVGESLNIMDKLENFKEMESQKIDDLYDMFWEGDEDVPSSRTNLLILWNLIK